MDLSFSCQNCPELKETRPQLSFKPNPCSESQGENRLLYDIDHSVHMAICHTLLDPSYEGLVWSWMNLEDKSDIKGQILYDFIYMSYLEESNQRQKTEWCLPRARREVNKEILFNGDGDGCPTM